MYAARYVIPVTTAADGSATAYTENVWGRVLSVIYVKDGTTPFDNGGTLTVTAEATGEAILTKTNLNASAVFYPRPGVCDTSAAALTYDGTHAVGEPVTLANDRVKLVMASGGATKNGAFHVVIG